MNHRFALTAAVAALCAASLAQAQPAPDGLRLQRDPDVQLMGGPMRHDIPRRKFANPWTSPNIEAIISAIPGGQAPLSHASRGSLCNSLHWRSAKNRLAFSKCEALLASSSSTSAGGREIERSKTWADAVVVRRAAIDQPAKLRKNTER